MSALFGLVQRSVERDRAHAATIEPHTLLFDRQLQLVHDPARFKTALCGRRAGKTSTAVVDFAHGMREQAFSLNVFIALSIASAREILWEPFKQFNHQYKWGFVFDESKMIVKHPNGSRLLVRGADDKRELEKLRGPKFTRIRIDECGAHRPTYLQYLVEEVLEATLMDCDGDVWLMGTCTPQAFGFFCEATSGVRPGYSVHRWTAENNPHVNWHEFIHNPLDHARPGLLARRGWTVDHPIFRREYLAEWVIDSERLVYRFERERNVVQALPELQPGDTWKRILSLDFGVNHATAAAVIAYPTRYGREAYVEHTWKRHGLAPSEAADLIRQTHDQFEPGVMIGDAGGLGKAFLQELARRHPGLLMHPAEKADKRAALEFTSDALYTAKQSADFKERRGLLSLACNEDLHREWASLQWDEERKDIADGQDDDVSHAAMYGFRLTPAFKNGVNLPVPPPDLRGTTQQWDHKKKRHVDPEHEAFANGWFGRRPK